MDWLSWLAGQMKKQAQSVFMVEELQPRWLDSTGQRLAYEAVTALSVGLIVTLAGEASAVLLGGLTELLLDCLKYGSIIGLSILLGCRSPSTVKNIAVSGLVFGLLVGLLGELLGGAANRIVGRLPDALAVTILTIRMLLIGLLGGIIGSLNEIRLIKIIRWHSTQF